MTMSPLEAWLEKLKIANSQLSSAPQREAIAVIEKLKEALEKYALEDNWKNSHEEDGWLWCEHFSPGWRDMRNKAGDDLTEGIGTYYVAGKSAREALAIDPEKLNER